MPWLSQVKGVVEAWYPGEEDGNAISAVLFGQVNPSGKLPVTFPSSDTGVPANTPQQWPGVNGVATYSEGLDVGYRYDDASGQTPLFPFGFGLSYTTFSFSNLQISSASVNGTQDEQVSATVTNTGGRVGDEVAEPLEVHGLASRRDRPDRVAALLADVGIPDPAVRAREVDRHAEFVRINFHPGSDLAANV